MIRYQGEGVEEFDKIESEEFSPSLLCVILTQGGFFKDREGSLKSSLGEQRVQGSLIKLDQRTEPLSCDAYLSWMKWLLSAQGNFLEDGSNLELLATNSYRARG